MHETRRESNFFIIKDPSGNLRYENINSCNESIDMPHKLKFAKNKTQRVNKGIGHTFDPTITNLLRKLVALLTA
jgi:hypothetical protein